MTINISYVNKIVEKLTKLPYFKLMVGTSIFLSVIGIVFSFLNHVIIAYGDSESHLNIAKRVVTSLTPGLAQLGGIWPPIPHLMMVPLVYSDFLWRTGLAGAIVSGVCFVVTCIYLYKFTYLLTKSTLASFVAFLVFALNPNILYMQSTPMTELPLLAFSMGSIYYFVGFIKNDKDFIKLILSAFFAFLASLSRYDGWFLVGIEALILFLMYRPSRKTFSKTSGRIVLFSSLAFFGIALWMLWDFLILGDPLYFTNSQFSAKSQQQSWLARGELPAYKNLLESFIYYFVTAMSNAGVIVFAISIIGLIIYLVKEKKIDRWFISLLLLVPFIFYVITQYAGQSIIFIPHITPTTFDWTLFNVRYGLMVIPAVAFFVGYLFHIGSHKARSVLITLFMFQMALFFIGYSPVITLADGTVGLSAAKKVDAQQWMASNYDYGLVLLDDFARTLSVIRSGLPMQKVIYVGNKPYWDESLVEPEKYARWIIIQKDDAVWNAILLDEGKKGRLYHYFQKVYTSPEILIFKRNDRIT